MHEHQNGHQHQYHGVIDANKHMEHKTNEAHHKDSHSEATNVKMHSKHDETEKVTEKESTMMTTSTTAAPINHALSELKKKIHDQVVSMAQMREATEEKLRETAMRPIENNEHEHEHDSCVRACREKSQSQDMVQQNLLG